MSKATLEVHFSDCLEIAEILGRRADEVERFRDNYCKDPSHIDGVELALNREISRLKSLRSVVMSHPELLFSNGLVG